MWPYFSNASGRVELASWFRLRPERYRPGKGGVGTVPETGANG